MNQQSKIEFQGIFSGAGSIWTHLWDVFEVSMPFRTRRKHYCGHRSLISQKVAPGNPYTVYQSVLVFRGIFGCARAIWVHLWDVFEASIPFRTRRKHYCDHNRLIFAEGGPLESLYGLSVGIGVSGDFWLRPSHLDNTMGGIRSVWDLQVPSKTFLWAIRLQVVSNFLRICCLVSQMWIEFPNGHKIVLDTSRLRFESYSFWYPRAPIPQQKTPMDQDYSTKIKKFQAQF